MKDVLLIKLNRIRGALLLLLLALSFNTFAQTSITGRVTAAQDGTPLPGVTVHIKGTQNGTVTDVRGNYHISAVPGTILVFTSIGYLEQSVIIGSGSVYNVKLSPDARTLVEVNVVAIGYGTAKQKDVTGSIGSVSAATIAKVPVTTLEQSLQGRVAGVQVTNNDGAPGGNLTVLIRGTGSLAQYGNSPLYVIDGYPLEAGGINNINPNDIASIDVLKDASATAIYGVRAANGVVIITTKRGRKDGTVVSVDAYTQFQAKPKEYNVLDAQQFATVADAQAANDPAKSFTVLPAWNDPSSLTEADWQNAVYRSGMTQNYTIAIRGGGDKAQSATSVGYYDQKGIVLGSYFKRLTVSNNVDYQPTSWLRSSTNVKYTYQDSNNPFGTGSLGQLAQLPPTLDGGNKTTSQIDDNGNYGFYNPIYTYVAKYTNPVYTIETNRYANISQFFVANASLEATIIDGLKIKTNAGATVTNYNGSYFSPEDDVLVDQYGAQAGATQNAFYSQSTNNNFDWLWENTLTYDKTFGKHTINFVTGVSEQEVTYNQFSGSGVPPNGVIRDISQVTNLQLGTSAQQITSLASEFARLAYNYASKYYISGIIRRDGSSKFDEGHKYGVFPSGAVKWRAKQESFLSGVDWLSDLDFRGSYGLTGNQGSVPDFAYLALYSAGLPATDSGNGGYPFGKSGSTGGVYQNGITSPQPENPNLKWETDYQTDIGTDVSFLKGDLTLTVDYYNRRSKDFLLDVATPLQTGYASEPENVGSMTNKGWEFALNYNHSINNFRYGVGVTVSANRNTLTSLNSGATFYTNPQGSPSGAVNLNGNGWPIYSETNIGQGIGEFYGYKAIGIIQSQAQIDALNANAIAQSKGVYQYYYMAATGPGNRLFADINHDGVVTSADETSIGSPQPKFLGGLNLDGAYKNFDITLYFYGVYGNKILNYEESNLETFQNRGFVGIDNLSVQYVDNAWTPSNHSNIYPRIYYNDNSYGDAVPSSAWIENGSFLKLKTVNLGYTVPGDLAKRLDVSKIRVYVSTQNLFTITSYKGLDPEIGTQGGYATQTGVDNGTYPSSRFFTVGLNVTF